MSFIPTYKEYVDIHFHNKFCKKWVEYQWQFPNTSPDQEDF